MSRYRLTIHPADAQLWKEMTGRDEQSGPPVQSRAGLDSLLESAARNSVRVLEVHEVDAASEVAR